MKHVAALVSRNKNLLNKHHHAFPPTQPVFDDYLYIVCLNHSIVIRRPVQKPKMHGKNAKLLRDLVKCHMYKYTVYVTIGFCNGGMLINISSMVRHPNIINLKSWM
jgi:hypothetical protein